MKQMPSLAPRSAFIVALTFIVAVNCIFTLAPAGAEEAVPSSIRGIVRAVDETVLSAGMAGKIRSLPFEEGDRFKAGDRLVTFVCDIEKAEQAVIQAAVNSVKAQYEHSKKLDALGSAGVLDLIIHKASLDEELARLRSAKATARLCEIRAPFDGFVLSRPAVEHESVAIMAALLKVARQGPREIIFIAPLDWLSRVKIGDQFIFRPFDGQGSAAGKISRIAPAVDPASQTVRIRGVLSGEGPGLRPGTSGTATFHFNEGLGE